MLHHSLDVLLIQEARLYGAQDLTNEMTDIDGYDTWWNLCTKTKGYSGMGIIARSGLVTAVMEGLTGASEASNKEARSLTIVISNTIAIVNIYAPSTVNRPERVAFKLQFFAYLKNHLSTIQQKGYQTI